MATQEDNLRSVVQKYEEQKPYLIYDEGVHIEATDCADAWRSINSFMLSANMLKLYRMGNRHMVPRVRVLIQKWGNLIPLETFGYRRRLRLDRLERNYLNEESLSTCRKYMDARVPNKHNTHGITFGTGRKKTPPCMVSGCFYWNPGRLLVNFNLRASEVTKTLGADFHFLNRVIFGDSDVDRRGAVPDWMADNLSSVVLNLDMAFLLAQWFPLIDIIMPGYPLNTDHRFHRMCMRSVGLAQNYDYESKWKPERRILAHVRKQYPKFTADQSGRIISGPSFFPFPS